MSASLSGRWGRRVAQSAAALLLAAGVLGAAPLAARETVSSSAEISRAELPREARETLALIQRGGPFPYRKDGTVFQNREQRLPPRARAYYTEYTVLTPWENDRGPRRIVAGKGPSGDPATSGEYWYSADHYKSFRRIRE